MGSTRQMKAYVDENSNPRPDLDYREVPISVMAVYCGMTAAALHRRLENGTIGQNKGILTRGKTRYFKPRDFLGISHGTDSQIHPTPVGQRQSGGA